MTLRPAAAFALIGVATALAACGGSDGGKAATRPEPGGELTVQSSTIRVPTLTAPPATSGVGAPKRRTTPKSAPLGPRARRTVSSCRSATAAAIQLSRATRAKLAALCRRAASGDRRAVNAAAREACLAVIKDLRLSGKTAVQARRSCAGARN